MNRHQQAALQFARQVKAWGFRVWLAEGGDYGFVSDAEGKRTLSFSFSGAISSLSGNYGPPSTNSGTGWKMDLMPEELRSAEDVRAALYAHPPEWTRRGGVGWKHYTTVAQHLEMYQKSSRYTEFTGATDEKT